MAGSFLQKVLSNSLQLKASAARSFTILIVAVKKQSERIVFERHQIAAFTALNV